MSKKISLYKSQFDYPRLTFLTTAVTLSDLPTDQGYEIAVIGRSNSGKSTFLNCIANQRQLARTSKMPGRTQFINLFKLDEERRLVDLPGYGYAKAAYSKISAWQRLTNSYLDRRQCLCSLILLMDCRHPLQSSDQQIIEWSMNSQLPLYIVLTKIDKISRNVLTQTQFRLQQLLPPTYAQSITPFSAKTCHNLPEVYQVFDKLFLNTPCG